MIESAKQLINELGLWLDELSAMLSDAMAHLGKTGAIYTLIIRWIFPLLALFIFLRCALPLLHKGKKSGAWGYLRLENGVQYPLMHWENSIGRGKLSDVLIDLPGISRSHAVLSYRKGEWRIYDLNPKGDIEVNGGKIGNSAKIKDGDTISMTGITMTKLPSDADCQSEPEKKEFLSKLAYRGRHISAGTTLFLIVLFQLFGMLQLCFSMGAQTDIAVPVSVLLLILIECFYFILTRRRGGKYTELELFAFFLCGLGLFIVSSAAPGQLYKQLIAVVLGVIAFSVLKGLIGNLNRARKLKYVLAAFGLGLLAFNLIFGEYRFGAKNWIDLGFMSFQPSEFVKVSFVIAGAATLDRLLTAKNLTKFILYSGACLGSLILMRDLGTALIFFITFLVIAFMRSGDIKTIAIISGGAVIGAVAAILIMPYIAARFEAWGNVWAYADTSGYQQTRTMIYAASGGLLGLGGGNGYLINIAAADTDLVFGVLCEEWGLLTAVTVVLIIAFFAFFTVLITAKCRSSFYVIIACGAAAVFLTQTALNVLGSVDLLPLTGVTLPFVSNGGSSMIASWCLLAFIKAADERRRPDIEDIICEELDMLNMNENADPENEQI